MLLQRDPHLAEQLAIPLIGHGDEHDAGQGVAREGHSALTQGIGHAGQIATAVEVVPIQGHRGIQACGGRDLQRVGEIQLARELRAHDEARGQHALALQEVLRRRQRHDVGIGLALVPGPRQLHHLPGFGGLLKARATVSFRL